MAGGGMALEASASSPTEFLPSTPFLLLQITPLTIPKRSSPAKVITWLSLPTLVSTEWLYGLRGKLGRTLGVGGAEQLDEMQNG
jgi:hypothetical protein